MGEAAVHPRERALESMQLALELVVVEGGLGRLLGHLARTAGAGGEARHEGRTQEPTSIHGRHPAYDSRNRGRTAQYRKIDSTR